MVNVIYPLSRCLVVANVAVGTARILITARGAIDHEAHVSDGILALSHGLNHFFKLFFFF